MHRTLASIPHRAGAWRTSHLSFPDRPDEKFVLRHRNILDAVQSLWGDPELAKHLVYRPRRLFTRRKIVVDEKEKEEITNVYNEMWTADWWWQLQVSDFSRASRKMRGHLRDRRNASRPAPLFRPSFWPPTRRSYPVSLATNRRGLSISPSATSLSLSAVSLRSELQFLLATYP